MNVQYQQQINAGYYQFMQNANQNHTANQTMLANYKDDIESNIVRIKKKTSDAERDKNVNLIEVIVNHDLSRLYDDILDARRRGGINNNQAE